MSAPETRSAPAWASAITEAYAADAKPPLTDELTDRLRQDLAAGLGAADRLDGEAVGRVNEVLDAFELSLKAVAGPRLRSASDKGEVDMAFRSEAGRPLRSFGGQ